jgi:hypothetical protein
MKYEVYCDESCIEALFDKSSHDYTVIGGIWIPTESRSDIKRKLNAIRTRYGKLGELKWNKVSPATKDMYKEIIDLFFNTYNIRFRAITIKTELVDNNAFNSGSGELGFYKFYFQLIQKWLIEGNSYRIFLDYKVNAQRSRVQDLCRILRYSTTATVEFTQSLPSEQSVLIQLADVLTGVVSSAFNNSNDTKESKREVREHVERYLGHGIKATLPSEQKFNVFDINLRKGW